MSGREKDRERAGPNLRLLGSPVQLARRGGGGGGRRQGRGRPRSAAPQPCYTPDPHEKSKRPFSADNKTHSHSIRNFLTERRDLDGNDYILKEIKAVPPTTALLEDHNNGGDTLYDLYRQFYSNTSDHGSEDTYVSLGTKIKAKAQIKIRNKLTSKHYLKYIDIAKKDKEQNFEGRSTKGDDNLFDLKVSISESKTPIDSANFCGESSVDRYVDSDYENPKPAGTYESYFISENYVETAMPKTDSLAGRVSFGNSSVDPESEHAIDVYSRRMSLNKQQLSLVEEESTQDLESMPSQPFSSLSPQASLDKKDDVINYVDCKPENIESDRATYVVDSQESESKIMPRNNFDLKSCVTKSFENGARTYECFYDDFKEYKLYKKNKSLSSTVLTAIEPPKVQPMSYQSTLPNTTEFCSIVDKKNFNVKTDSEQHVSLECIALENMAEDCNKKISPRMTCQWTDPHGHSLLLSKDFFLTKDSNTKSNLDKVKIEAETDIMKADCNESENNAITEQYPSYLSNSISKVYTSKVLEDYKKEIKAIDNLHELTLKDIKTDCISPTPLNIDLMFEQMENESESKEKQAKKFEDLIKIDKKDNKEMKNTNMNSNVTDISNISTRELIQNYFRVKDSDKVPPKMSKTKIIDEKPNSAGDNNNTRKQQLNYQKNSPVKPKYGKGSKSPLTSKFNNHKNETITRIPLSSRIECVQNDKDVDSWISLTTPTPRKDILNNYDSYKTLPSLLNKPNKDQSESAQDTYHKYHSRSPEQHIESEVSNANDKSTDLNEKSTVMDIYSMLKEIESFGDKPVIAQEPTSPKTEKQEDNAAPKDHFMEIFTFLEKVEHSANEALSVVTSSAPQVVPKLETLLRLPQTELAQRYVTAALQLEERSCCIALLQESLANHKEQMIAKISNLEKQSHRNVSKVKQECEEAVKRHQNFIDQLINDKKTLNHRIEQLVDERRALEERWKRSTQALEDRYKLELKNQHDKMAAAQQVARQRWVRQKAEKIKELTVKGLEGELREMSDRQLKEISDLKMSHAEYTGRLQAKHAAELEQVRLSMQEDMETALAKERQLASSRMEKQILELELTYQEQRGRLVSELRAENERAAKDLAEREKQSKVDVEKWRQEQEKEMEQRMARLDEEIARQREILEEQLNRKRDALQQEFDTYKHTYECEQQALFKKRVTELAAQHKQERDREIERAIESMEAEAQAGRRELQEALRRNKEQFEAELRELGETEKATLKRYQEAQARVRQTEDKCADLEGSISQLEAKNRALTDKCSQLESLVCERERGAEKTWRERLETLQREMETLKSTHEEQMHQLYAKVKVAVARKDSAIQALTRESDKAQEKITLLEQRLQQQRKDFLKHK